MKFLRSFFKRITDDLKQKKLIPLKILFFVHASTLFVLYPYLTIHMRELGINVEETAIMSAVTPVVSIVMPPLAGMLADKIGNFRVSPGLFVALFVLYPYLSIHMRELGINVKETAITSAATPVVSIVMPPLAGMLADKIGKFRLLLALSSALGGASALLLLAVPVGRITVTFPPAVQLLVSCDGTALRLQHVHDHPCHPLHPYAYDVNLTTLSCGFVCDLPPGMTKEQSDEMLHMHSYVIQMQSPVSSQQLVYRHTVSSFLKPMVPKKDKSTARILTNDPLFNTTATLVPPKQIFFPAPQLYKMECSNDSQNATCYFAWDSFLSEQKVVNDESNFRIRISHDAAEIDARKYTVKAITAWESQSEFVKDVSGIESTTCVDSLSKGLSGVSVRAGTTRFPQCASACAAAAPRTSLCENKQQPKDLDPVFTFWAYLAVRVFIGIIGGTAFAMFEGAVIAIVREQRADYGLQRVYGSIGGMISSPLSGLLIDYASRGKGYTDFRPAFYLYAVLKVLSGALMLSIDLEFKQPAQNLLEDVISVFRSVEIVALFIACFIMGTAWGYIESFLFWLLQDLGASRSLMGITITVGGVAGLPLLVLSGPIIRRLGHANVLFIGFVFYAIRLLGYSLIYNPWLCLVFEALESVTSSLSFTAAVTYAARLSSTTTDTSVQGLLGGLYYGVGKGAGSLIGGYLMKFFGTRPTYQIFACATFVTGCIYFLFNKFYIGKRAIGDENDLCKKKSAIADVENRGITSETDKGKAPLDGASKPDINTSANLTINTPNVPNNQKTNLEPDNTDGGSDSGVENPAYTETESISSNAKKNDSKVG